MIDEEDEALIMDFGIARSSANTHSGVSQVVGTLAYMAPEQAQAKTTDQRADVYALGMMAREMLVGRTGGDSQQAVADLMQRMKEAPPRVRTIDPLIPEPLDALVARCVEPDAADRFQTSTELAEALATLDENGHLRPNVVPKASAPWRLIAASVVSVAALLSGTWWYTRTPPPVKPHDPVTVLIADFNNNTGNRRSTARWNRCSGWRSRARGSSTRPTGVRSAAPSASSHQTYWTNRRRDRSR